MKNDVKMVIYLISDTYDWTFQIIFIGMVMVVVCQSLSYSVTHTLADLCSLFCIAQYIPVLS